MRFLKLKNIILVGLLVAGIVLLTGSTSLAGEKRPKIGFVSMAFGDAYDEALIKGAKRGAELNGCDLVLKDGRRDAAIIVKHIRTLTTQKVDAILVQTIDPERLKPAVTAAYNANVPVITINMEVNAPHAAYVGVDYWSGGRLAGEIIAEALNGKGKMVNITGDPGCTCTIGRDGGMNEILAKYPNIKTLDTQPAFWDREKAMKIAERFLIAYPDLDLIVANSCLQALGVLAAVKEVGKLDQVKIVTYDLPKYMIDLIKKGEIYGTSYDMPIDIGRIGAELAAYIISLEYTSEKWESVTAAPEFTKGPAWKKTFGAIFTGSGQATVNDIDKVPPGDAF